jgi:hypothetical protein
MKTGATNGTHGEMRVTVLQSERNAESSLHRDIVFL